MPNGQCKRIQLDVVLAGEVAGAKKNANRRSRKPRGRTVVYGRVGTSA